MRHRPSEFLTMSVLLLLTQIVQAVSVGARGGDVDPAREAADHGVRTSDVLSFGSDIEPENPLGAIPLQRLSATRGRPLFSVSRRPDVSIAPRVLAPASPSPVAPETPKFSLVGTVLGNEEKIAVFLSPMGNSILRLHVGEATSGWRLRSVGLRSAVVEKSGQTVSLELPTRDVRPNAPNR